MTATLQLARTEDSATSFLNWLTRYRWWLFAGVALFYVAGFHTQWQMGSDSALYMVLGRSLYEGEGYRFGDHHHRQVYPLLPWMLAGLWRISGGVSTVAANALMLLLTLGGLSLWYHAFTLRFGRALAVGMILLTAMAEVVFTFAFRVLTEPPYFFGIAAVFAAYEGLRAAVQPPTAIAPPRIASRRIAWYLLLLALGIFMAVTCRPTMMALVAALVGVGLWHMVRGPGRVIHGVIAVITVGCVMLFYQLDPRQAGQEGRMVGYEAGAVTQLAAPMRLADHLRQQSLPTWFDSHACEAMLGVALGGPLNWLMGLVVIVLGVWSLRWRGLWGVFCILSMAIMLVYHPVVRYFMPVLPILAAGWFLLVCRLLRSAAPWRHWLAVGLLALWLVPNIGRDVGILIDQRRTPFMATFKEGRYEPIQAMGQWAEQHTQDNAVLISPYGRVMAWFSHRTVIDADRVADGFQHAWLNRAVQRQAVFYVLTPTPPATIDALMACGYRPDQIVYTTASHLPEGSAWQLVRWRVADASPPKETHAP